MQRANVGLEEGLYDRNGFYFRQRRGHLNLRKFEALDLERIIREVDVDLLQQTLEELTFSKFTEHEIQFFSDKQVVKLFNLAQLTIEYLLYSQEKLVNGLNDLAKKYTAKKRSLHQKRKEMNALKEETTSLQHQLKAKRRNLATLEKVVREANEIKAAEAPPKPKQVPFVKFFMTLPDGLFVEFEELRETTVRQLILMLRNALANHRSQQVVSEAGDGLKLFLKGKLLILDHSLERCGIQDGDTILISLPEEKPIRRVEEAPKPVVQEVKIIEKPDKDSLFIQQKVLEAVEKQVHSLEELAAHLAKSKQPEVKDTLSDRLAEELARIHDLLERNRSQPAATEAPRVAPLILGDLEPDGDDNAMAIQEINLKLMQSNLRMSSLDNNVQMSMTDLKELLRLQQEELVELRKALMQRPAPVAPSTSQTIIYEAPRQLPPQQSTIIIQQQPQPQPEPVVQTVVIEEKPKPKPQQRKFVVEELKEIVQKQPSPAPVAEEKKFEKPVEIVMDFEPKPKLKEEPKPEPKPVEVPKPVVEVPKPVEAPLPKVEEAPVVVAPEMVPITFLAQNYVGYVPPNAEDLTVEVESDLQVVDIIFEVRKAVANKMSLPFKSTCLVMDGRAIKLGVDIDDNVPFSPKDAAQYALEGRLGIKFERVQLLTNDKIDRITPAFEKTRSESKLRDSADAKDKLTAAKANDVKKSGGSKASYFHPRRSYEDEESYGEEEKQRGFKTSYANMRTSFDTLLRDLSERRSLSDQELIEKRKLLEATSASDSESAKKMRSSLAKAISTIAVESGSESAGDEFFRSSLRFSRDLSASVNAPNRATDRSGLGGVATATKGAERESIGNWRAMVASSPDFITLRSKEAEEDDVLPEMSRSFSQSLPRGALAGTTSVTGLRRAPRRSYEDDAEDSTPMLSSLTQPLSRFADTHEHLPIGGRAGAVKDAAPSVGNNRSTVSSSFARGDDEFHGSSGDRYGNSREELYDEPPRGLNRSFKPHRSWQPDEPDTTKAAATATSQSSSRFMGDDEPTPSFISSLGSRDQSAFFSASDTKMSGAEGKSTTAFDSTDREHQGQRSNKASPPQAKMAQSSHTSGDAKGVASLASTIQSQPSQNFELSTTLDSSGRFPEFGTGEIRRAADAYERTGDSSALDATELSALDTTLHTDDGVEAFGASKGSNDSPFKTLQFRGRSDSRDSTAASAPFPVGDRRHGGHSSAAAEDATHEFDTMSTHSLAISDGDKTIDQDN